MSKKRLTGLCLSVQACMMPICAGPVRLFVIPEEQTALQAAAELDVVVRRLTQQQIYSISFSPQHAVYKGRRKQVSYSYLDASRRDIILICVDITETYQQERIQFCQVQEALAATRRANQAKSKFLSNMSHDMRTPLSSLIGFTQLALDEQDREKRRTYLKKITMAGTLLMEIINDTLDLSRIESGQILLKPEIVFSRDIIESVETTIQAATRAKQIHFYIDMNRSFPTYIYIDIVNAKKVLLNLLSNAVKFTPSGGTITFTIEYLESPVKNSNWRFIIQDTGIGISPEFLPHIFEPFERENNGDSEWVSGTGLGLAIVQQLVRLMKGFIEVESVVGKGTTVMVYTPLTLAEKPKDRIDRTNFDEELAGKHILLCEDHPINAELARLLLEDKGMTVTTAADGKAGIEAFEASPFGSIAAILMDIRMPCMDGFQAARAIRGLQRADGKRVPIIAMTADAFDDSVALSRQAGFTAYLAKPVAAGDLYRTLAEQIRCVGGKGEDGSWN